MKSGIIPHIGMMSLFLIRSSIHSAAAYI